MNGWQIVSFNRAWKTLSSFSLIHSMRAFILSGSRTR